MVDVHNKRKQWGGGWASLKADRFATKERADHLLYMTFATFSYLTIRDPHLSPL